MNLGKILKNKSGFSLVELLLVVLIVTLFSTLALYSYLSYRESVVLNLAFDSINSQLDEQKNSAIYGVNTKINLDDLESLDFSEANVKCYGVFAENNQLFSFNQDYYDQKVWDDVAKMWQYNGCSNFENKDFSLMDIGDGVGVELEDFALRFVPPKGEIELSDDFENFSLVQSFDLDFVLNFNDEIFQDFALNVR